MALNNTRGAHPAMRLDTFLRSTDLNYQHGEAPTQGDRFIRKMATYGQVRPSVSFTNEARVLRSHKDFNAVDMSRLPAPWNDPRGDPREGSLEIPAPPKDIDCEFIKLYKNHSLMLPSERYREHLRMKEAEKQWHQDRENLFRYRKRMNVLERKHPEGVVGVDGPLFPGTKLYAERRGHMLEQAERRLHHAEGRFNTLAAQAKADEALTGDGYGSDPGFVRSQDICIQRKRVDPAAHPFRFLDTHERIFPVYTPEWDPERAAAIRSHDVRDKRHNIISGIDNSVEYKVAKRWDEPPGTLVNGPAYP